MGNNTLTTDVNNFLSIYPSYSYHERPEKKYSIIEGEIDICDVNGSFWGSFDIKILINKDKYPYDSPIVCETSTKIKRDIGWHIDDEGTCCLDIHHRLEYDANKGINITVFYQEKIYPFFANAIYRKIYGKYANGEYRHGFGGVKQFYKETLNLTEVHVIINTLNSIINNRTPRRNDPCLCGSKNKFKYCHLDSFNFLKNLPINTIKKDLEKFKHLI
ncbi:hypothetical protein HER15_08010 [Tenacibaculum mesophilum]|uniref:SEC-C motif-containing protein n=1 Tax=Tenacibaculum mesophilum TaxID=104268 RepID=A0AAE9MLA7_9FLAO|nr:SEC-C metal-binding domain-containing protein [Tenacibaculum mesophilum]UTD15412.1 hypothetical protein HER15_08010 [Tenacibaculum mesophilum]